MWHLQDVAGLAERGKRKITAGVLMPWAGLLPSSEGGFSGSPGPSCRARFLAKLSGSKRRVGVWAPSRERRMPSREDGNGLCGARTLPAPDAAARCSAREM